VKVTLIPSSVAHEDRRQRQYLTSYLLNDTVAIDGGSIGLFHTPQEQVKVRNLLLSHTHIDHIASLAVFIENLYEGKGEPVTIHGSDDVLDCLQKDLFNDRLWPDFIGMTTPKTPFMRTSLMEAGKTIVIDGLNITPIPVNHVVPTFGFLVADKTSTIVIATDTGPTDEIWQHANAAPNLKAVFLEATFPDNMQWLADLSKHHTPATFLTESRKIHRQVPILVMHIKPRFHDLVVSELHALGLPNLEIVEYGKTYTY